MAKKYTNKANVENYLLKTIDSSFGTQIDKWIEAMSMQIDAMCNRVIWAGGTEDEPVEAVSMLYDGNGGSVLRIDDCTEIEYVKVNGIEVGVLEYPTNKAYTSRLVLTDGQRFTKGLQNVEVVAIPGMSAALPPDVEFACTVLVAGICNAQVFQLKEGTTERIGNYSITYKERTQQADFHAAKLSLSGYRRLAL